MSPTAISESYLNHFLKENFKTRYHHLRAIVEKRIDAELGKKVRIDLFVRNLFCHQIGKVLQNVELSTRQTETFMLAQNTVLNVYMVGKWPRIALWNPRYISAQNKTNRFSKALIAHYKNRSPTDTETYMDRIELGRRERPEWFTDGDVHAHTLLPFTGGVDPAGGSMSFLLYEMITRPDITRRVRDEVDRFCRQGFPSFEALDQMEDLQGFIYEVLRLHPTGFALSRTASDNIQFDGYLIPNSRVGIK